MKPCYYVMLLCHCEKTYEWVNGFQRAHNQNADTPDISTTSYTPTHMPHITIIQKSHFTSAKNSYEETHSRPPPTLPPPVGDSRQQPKKHHTNIPDSTFIRLRPKIITSSFTLRSSYARFVVVPLGGTDLRQHAYYTYLWTLLWNDNNVSMRRDKK